MGRVESGGWRSAVLICGVFATLFAGLHPASARAQGTPPTAEPAPPQASAPPRRPWREAMERAPASEIEAAGTERVWYGWQTLLVDLSGVALLVGGAAADEEMFAIAGLAVIGLGSPIVHFAHQNSSAAVISFAIRATSIGLLFLGVVLISQGIFSDEGSFDSASGAIGVVAAIASVPGALAAVIVDASLLAFDKRPRSRQRASLAPWVDTRRGSYGVRFALSL